jgi:hypothetical protein
MPRNGCANLWAREGGASLKRSCLKSEANLIPQNPPNLATNIIDFAIHCPSSYVELILDAEFTGLGLA